MEEKNNEAKKYKMLLDKYDVDTEDLSQLEDILKSYDKWQLELDEIMNKGTCGYCKMKHEKLQEENEQLKEQLNNTDFYREYCRLKSSSDDLIKGLTEQCQQLKSQPLEIVEKIKKELEMNGDSYCEIRECNSPHTNHQYAWFNYVSFREVIDTMLKEYQEEVK